MGRLLLVAALASLAATPALAAAPGRLIVKATYFVNSPTRCCDEGSYRYLTIKLRGRVVARRRSSNARTTTLFNRRLSPGRYRVVTYLRGCEGTCDSLGPPTQKCARYFAVPSGRRTTVVSQDTSGEPLQCPAVPEKLRPPRPEPRPEPVIAH